MSNEIPPKPEWDKRTGEQYTKDKQAVNEVTDKILAPDFKQEVPDDLQKLMLWRNEVRTRVFAHLEPIVQMALVRAPGDPAYAHSRSGKGMLLHTAHKLYLDELRKMNREDAIFLLAFIYAERTLEDFL